MALSPRSVGVEEEFLVLRPHGMDLAAEGADVVASASATDGAAQFERELKQAQVELASTATESLASLTCDLKALRHALAAACTDRDVRLVASGTSPGLEPARTTLHRRYQEMNEQFGLVARQQLTCGMHIHVSVESTAEAVHVLDGIAPWLPLLTGLSSNSPFYAGEDTGYASYRSVLWGQWPTAGPTGPFRDAAAYEALQNDLIALGAARDKGMVYFDARASTNYPTVEIRVCDVCVQVEDAVVIAGLARALVEWVASRDTQAPVRTELLRAASWRAARWGMTGDLVDLTSTEAPRLVPAWELGEQLLQHLASALDVAGDAAAVYDGLEQIRSRGTGADLQRSVYTKRGDFGPVLDAVTVPGRLQ